ncbi:MAG: ATP-binding cassette domain-containing protein [Ginsengibacter sp.]
METILSLQNVNKKYKSGGSLLTVLDNISFSVNAGASMAIVGPSGSGKTTLLGLCAGLDQPYEEIWRKQRQYKSVRFNCTKTNYNERRIERICKIPK